MVIAGFLPSISSFEIATYQDTQASQAEDILGSEWVLWSDKKHNPFVVWFVFLSLFVDAVLCMGWWFTLLEIHKHACSNKTLSGPSLKNILIDQSWETIQQDL